jgi:hypothetical protein
VNVKEHVNAPPSSPTSGASTTVPEKPPDVCVYVIVKAGAPPGSVQVVSQLDPLVVGVEQLSATTPPSEASAVGGHVSVADPVSQSLPPVAVAELTV